MKVEASLGQQRRLTGQGGVDREGGGQCEGACSMYDIHAFTKMSSYNTVPHSMNTQSRNTFF